MKLGKLCSCLTVALVAAFMFGLFQVPASAVYFDDFLHAGIWVPVTYGGGIHTDYWTYCHRNEIRGVLDGQGHYLKIIWDWEATCDGTTVYYYRSFYMKLADGTWSTWWDYGGPLRGNDPRLTLHRVYDYSSVPPQYRPVKFSVSSIACFSTFGI